MRARPIFGAARFGLYAATCFSLLAAVGVRSAAAQWAPNGMALSSWGANADEHVRILPDGTGGWVICWIRHQMTNTDLYFSRVDPSGAIQSGWPSDGLRVEEVIADPGVLPDGSGGVFETSVVVDPILVTQSAYARRLTAAGTLDPLWPAIQSPSPSIGSSAVASNLVTNGAGGAWIAWQSPTDLRATLVRANGQKTPANGIVLNSSTPMAWVTPTVVSDVAGGLIALWLSSDGAHLERMNAAGALLFGALSIGTGSGDASHIFTSLVPSGAGQFIAAWIEMSAGTPQLIALRFDVDGHLDASWPAGGRVIAHSSALNADARELPDGLGGAYLIWGLVGGAIQAQHVQADGSLAPGWNATGLALGGGAAPTNTYWAAAVSDVGGLLFSANGRVWWYLADGTLDPAQPTDGRLIHPTEAPEIRAIATDGSGGALAFWDLRSGASLRVTPMLTRLFYSSVPLGVGPGMPPAQFALRLAGANPARDAIAVSCSLPNDTPARLELLDLAGRRLRDVHLQGAGEHSERFDQLGHLPPGLYLVRLTQGTHVRSARVALVH